MLTEDELADLREDVETLMVSTATIQTATKAGNAQGGKTLTWTNTGTTPCQVVRKTGQGKSEGDRPGVVIYWLILMPLGTEVTKANRLVIDGQTYELQDPDDGRTFPLQLAFVARRVD